MKLAEIVVATHAGMTTDEFEQIVRDWLATARHPKTQRTFTEMVYQPMLELFAHLRANGFKTLIVHPDVPYITNFTTILRIAHVIHAVSRRRSDHSLGRVAKPNLYFESDRAGTTSHLSGT